MDSVYYDRISESIFIGILNDTFHATDYNREQCDFISRDFLYNLRECEKEYGLLDNLKVTTILCPTQRAELESFLRLFLDKHIDQMVKDENVGRASPGIHYSSERFLLLARYFLTIDDRRMASECIWGVAAIELKAFALNQCQIKLDSHRSLGQFCDALQQKDLSMCFDSCSRAHRDGFYEDDLDVWRIRLNMEAAEKFIAKLRGMQLTQNQIQNLKKRKF